MMEATLDTALMERALDKLPNSALANGARAFGLLHLNQGHNERCFLGRACGHSDLGDRTLVAEASDIYGLTYDETFEVIKAFDTQPDALRKALTLRGHL